MGTFYQLVLGVLGLLWLLIMVIVGYTLRTKAEKRGAVTPIPAACPDFWTLTSEGECQPSASNRGSFTSRAASFQDPVYAGEMGLCNKRKWAEQFNVAWDGITYGGTFPCA